MSEGELSTGLTLSQGQKEAIATAATDLVDEWLRESGNAGAVTPATVVRFKGWLQQRYSPQTVNLRLSTVRSFYRWCVITERLPVSPAESVKWAKRPNSHQHKRDALTNGEVLDVLVTCDPGTLQGGAIGRSLC